MLLYYTITISFSCSFFLKLVKLLHLRIYVLESLQMWNTMWILFWTWQFWITVTWASKINIRGHLYVCLNLLHLMDFPGGSVVKDPPANAGDARDPGPIPGSGRSPVGGNGNPLKYSCLENSMDRGAWRAKVHWVAKNLISNFLIIFSIFS